MENFKSYILKNRMHKGDKGEVMSTRLEDVLQGREQNYILPFFWQHGEEEAVLRHYMHVIHDANIGAVCVEARAASGFCRGTMVEGYGRHH